MKLTENQLRRIIRKELIREMSNMQDLSTPIPIDDLVFQDDGNGSMMLPGPGFSYSVRPENFEEKKAEIKARYGDDVMISVPNPGYPKSRKLHSKKFDSAEKRERNMFMSRQRDLKKRFGREPSLGT